MPKRPITADAILKRARIILARPHTWTKGNAAKTRDDVPVPVEDDRAAKFCLVGALSRAVFEINGQEDSPYEIGEALRLAQKTLEDTLVKRAASYSSITMFNDRKSTTKKDVVAVLDAARVILAKEGTDADS